MNSPENNGFSYFKVKISSSTLLSFSYYESKKLMEKRLDIYKLIEEENSLAWHSKASTMREVLILAVRLCMYMKKTV